MGFLRGSATPGEDAAEGNGNGKMTDYERTREERIRQNKEIMKELGIHDLSLKLKSLSKKPTPRSTPARKSPQHFAALTPPGPRRRSSRLQNAGKVDYAEGSKKKPEEDEAELLREDGYQPEFYTEEHLKLLGSTEKSWTLFVDGYASDGQRIYDSVKGMTCHQCRQKTLGLRTHCCKCTKVQGQFCGDCLYMRYGEHVLEANENPDWICPPCRGICNCSACRIAKGWPPTGSMYRKVSKLGFKSVAHYIIQTRQKINSDSDTTAGSKVPTSAKRSLPFPDTEDNPQFADADYTSYLAETLQPEVSTVEATLNRNCLNDVKPAAAADVESASNCLNDAISDMKPVVAAHVETTLNNCLNDAISDVTTPAAATDIVVPPSPADAAVSCATSAAATGGRGNGLNPEAPMMVDTSSTAQAVAETTPSAKPNRKRGHASEPSPNSIAARLRERRAAARARTGDL